MRLRLAGLLAATLFAMPGYAGEQLASVDAAGLRAALDEQRGQVVLVNFWATWCSPCLKEIPALMELEADLGGRGFTLIAVSLDEAASGDTLVKPFMEKHFPEFASYLSMESDMDDLVSVIDQGWNEVLPTSYLLNREGDVAERIQGSYTKEEFAAAIEPLL